MKITLINVQTIELNNLVPPLGLMYIAAVARDAGHKVQLLDVDPNEIDVVEKASTFMPDLIGLSFLTTEFEKACLLSHKLKKTFTNTILCCGGVHTTVDTENVLRQFNVDFCVVGEGEKAFIEVCKRIEANQPYEDVKSIWLLKNSQLIKNPRRELIENLDSIPFPARDLVNFANIYLTLPGVIRGKYIRSTSIVAGRGCNFNCSCCSVNKMFGRQYRLRNYDNVLKEIIYLKKRYGVKGVFFMDSTFTANKKWIMSFCQEIIRRGVKFVWTCNTRANVVDKEILDIMRKAGCIQIDYGVESGSPKVLEILNKKITVQKSISAVKMTQNAGIRVGANFMLGNPGEDINDLQMTFNLAKELKADYTIFFFSIPYPGTKLEEVARKRNLIPNDASYGNRWNLRTAELPLMCENVSEEDFKLYRAKFQNYFFMRNYFRLNNIIIGLQILWIMLKYPSTIRRGIAKVLKYKRLDFLPEEIMIGYRRKLYKYY